MKLKRKGTLTYPQPFSLISSITAMLHAATLAAKPEDEYEVPPDESITDASLFGTSPFGCLHLVLISF